MADYIDKGTAIAKLTALEVTEPNATMTSAKRMLADIPAADVVPVLHGRWVPVSERLPEIETEVLVVCNRNGYRFVCPAIYEDGKTLTQDSS